MSSRRMNLNREQKITGLVSDILCRSGRQGFLGDVHTLGVQLKFELVKSALARRTRGTFSSSLS